MLWYLFKFKEKLCDAQRERKARGSSPPFLLLPRSSFIIFSFFQENSITNLSAKPSSYWKDPNNARSFLTAYAAREGGASPLLSPFVFTLPSRSSFSFFSGIFFVSLPSIIFFKEIF